MISDYLKVYNFDNKIRLGNNSDGGYVIGNVPEYDCYISAGVSNEESFSRDFIKKFNMNKYNSYAFDGTINNYPYQYTKDITFIKKNIATYRSKTKANLSQLINNYNNIFLKMDIEGCEYDWLLSLTQENLNKFKQIVIEFHGINDDSWGKTYNKKLECFKLLSNTHYIIHAHGNNYSGTQNKIPDVIELTYLRKDYFSEQPEINTTNLPIMNLDFPCNPSLNDYSLNFYPFVN
jgi:FkbM family methyltransferase